MTDAIRTVGLTKRYGSTSVVDAVDLIVEHGSAFGFIGPNGAGKTTMIKMLLGVVRPSAGQIDILGGAPSDPRVRTQIGYLPENLQIPPTLSPRAFVHRVGRLKGWRQPELRVECERVLDQVGLDERYRRSKVSKLSKGGRQRAGLAGALFGRPALLVLDEPTDGIDPIGRMEIRRVITEAVGAGTTVFLNSHLLSETELVCNAVGMIAAGKLIHCGSIADLRADAGFDVWFEPAEGNPERFGFAAGADGRSTFENDDPVALSQALQSALQSGFVVREIHHKRRSLEAALAKFLEGKDTPQ